jgi:hypothetical protein
VNFKNAKDTQDLIGIARASGSELHAEDRDELENRIKRITNDNSQVAELSDDDLGGLTGGTSPAAALVGLWVATKALDATYYAVFD